MKKQISKQIKADGKKEVFPHKELTYKIIGICMKIHNKFGPLYREKHFQNMIEEDAKNLKISVERELPVVIYYNQRPVGKYYVDFVFDKKIVLETKKLRWVHPKSLTQMLEYLNALQLRIGLIINFGGSKLQIKRVILPEKYLIKSV